MSRIMHLSIFRHYNCKLKHGKDVSWSMSCQYRDSDSEKWCDFEEHGPRETVESAALHHLLTNKGHHVIVYKTVEHFYHLDDK